jgi:hypothetical protein
MALQVSHYPRVSEWLFIDDTAINMAAVISITFSADSAGDYAIVRLAGYHGTGDAERGETWFEVRESGLLRVLRGYVVQMAAPGAGPLPP